MTDSPTFMPGDLIQHSGPAPHKRVFRILRRDGALYEIHDGQRALLYTTTKYMQSVYGCIQDEYVPVCGGLVDCDC